MLMAFQCLLFFLFHAVRVNELVRNGNILRGSPLQYLRVLRQVVELELHFGRNELLFPEVREELALVFIVHFRRELVDSFSPGTILHFERFQLEVRIGPALLITKGERFDTVVELLVDLPFVPH